MPVIADARPRSPRTARRFTATIAGLGTVLLVGSAFPAAAAETAESNARARFLSGSVLRGVDLDRVVNLAGVSVTNVGLAESVVETGSVGVTALDTIRVPLEGGITIPLGDLMELGAVNQYAEAAPEGVSRSASGAVSDTGVVNTAGSGAFPADASISLTPLLGDLGVDQVVSELEVKLRAISAVAALDASRDGGPASTCDQLSEPEHCRDYNIAGGDLSLTAPGLAALATALTGPGGVAATVDQAVNGLAGDDGPLAQALGGANAQLAPLVGNDALSVTVTSNVDDSLDGIVNQRLTDGVVSINLATGEITADLEGLLGLQLNNLPPSTELLSKGLLNELAFRVTALLRTLPDLVNRALTGAVEAATLGITGSLCASGSTGSDCEQIVPVVGTDIGSGVFVTVAGTLGDVVDGSADASITSKTAGVETALPVGTVLSALAAPISSALLADGAAVDTAVDGVDAAVGPALDALAPVLLSLTDVASLLVNVQEDGPVSGSFREVALRLTLAGAAGPGGLATVDLARAQVGANTLPAPVNRPPAEVPEEEAAPAAAQTNTLPDTGAPDAAPLGVLAGLMLAVGTGLILSNRRRMTT